MTLDATAVLPRAGWITHEPMQECGRFPHTTVTSPRLIELPRAGSGLVGRHRLPRAHRAIFAVSEAYDWSSRMDVVDEKYEILRQQYQPELRGEVHAFLSENSFLLDLLPETFDRIQQYFGAEARLGLEVLIDPDDGSRELFALALTSRNPSDVRARRTRLMREWWLKGADARARQQMSVGAEFV